MKKFFILWCLLSSLIIAGEKEGTGGDPYIVEFHQRALFVLNMLRLTNPFIPEYIDKYAYAWQYLRVDITNDSLPTLGRVLEDPIFPGKKYILLDRSKFITALAQAESIDLQSLVAHEVFSTEGIDIFYELTRSVHFSEQEYKRWRAQYKIPEAITNPKDRYGSIAYSFITGQSAAKWDFETRSSAEESAFFECGYNDCQTVVWFKNSCAALSRVTGSNYSKRFYIGWDFDTSRTKALEKSLKRCEEKNVGQKCEIIEWACTSNSQP